jgi:glucose-6-phosphate isomerase
MKDNGQYPIPVSKSDLTHHWKQRLTGTNLTELKVHYKDAPYFKRTDPDLDPDTLIYEHIIKESTPQEGHLNWGHITLYPGMVKDQYFCTKGSFLSDPNAEEYLLCMQGEGLIMYLSPEGNCWCEELLEGSLHKVPAGTARRLINTGDEPLMLSECTPSTAQVDIVNTKAIPFPCHVYDDDGELAIEVDLDENEDSRGLKEEEIIALLGT